MQMAMCMKESGKMIKRMEKGFTIILMELNIKEIGWKINNMGME